MLQKLEKYWFKTNNRSVIDHLSDLTTHTCNIIEFFCTGDDNENEKKVSLLKMHYLFDRVSPQLMEQWLNLPLENSAEYQLVRTRGIESYRILGDKMNTSKFKQDNAALWNHFMSINAGKL